MPKPNTFDSLPEPVKEWLTQRQAGNAWSDIDGLTAALKERGHDIPRSTVGDINKYLKDRAASIKARQEGTTALLTALGDKAHDIGLSNIAMLHDHSQEILAKLRISEIDLDKLTPDQRLKVFFKLAGVQMEASVAAKNLQSARTELENRIKATADAVESIARKVGGISDDTINAIKKRILKLND